jgi:SAM-dependent methyltransferase
MQMLFGVTLLVSAALLFAVEPMFAKMVLPRLGGSPGVWNTCMVFYQAALLLGYVYAHATHRLLGPRRQSILHLIVLSLAWLVLPIAIRDLGPINPAAPPIPWLFGMLTLSVGLPFFAVSATAPMLQSWFAQTRSASAKDPYFLYAASNVGSLATLLAYPVLIEPRLRLSQQSWWWSIGYGVMSLLIAVCAAAAWRATGSRPVATADIAAESPPATAPALGYVPQWRDRIWWMLLAFVPSSLMLGVTTYISTDVASIPLIWIVPLAIYLLTFVLTFARWQMLPHWAMVLVQPYLVVVLAATFSHWDPDTTAFDWTGLKLTSLHWTIAEFAMHLLVFFVTAMVCHGELARRRPPAKYLTEFYLWMSLGGMLGGLFNALVAPYVFNWVAEYPLMIAAACLLRPTAGPQPLAIRWVWAAIGALGLAGAGFGIASLSFDLTILSYSTLVALTLASLTFAALSLQSHRLGLSVGVGATLLASIYYNTWQEQTIHRVRSFFGVLQVRYEPKEERYTLIHGTTTHGLQTRLPDVQNQAASYYYPSGPLGDLLLNRPNTDRHWAMVGLGTGSVAAYGREGLRLTFYEIDPVVVSIATNPEYFTYVSDSDAQIDIVPGDARLSLESAADETYDVLMLDAFSSDAIPLHLLTREALDLYLRKLKPRGVLAVHISNRYLDLSGVLNRLAEDAVVQAWIRSDDSITAQERTEGKYSSTWVAITKRPDVMDTLLYDPHWRPIINKKDAPLWTDDFSNIYSVIGTD